MAEERTADLSEALASAQLAWSSSEAREEKAVCALNEARTAATQERAELENRASTAEDLVQLLLIATVDQAFPKHHLQCEIR